MAAAKLQITNDVLWCHEYDDEVQIEPDTRMVITDHYKVVYLMNNMSLWWHLICSCVLLNQDTIQN